MKPFLNKYILFLMIKSHYVRHNKAFKFFDLSVSESKLSQKRSKMSSESFLGDAID